MPFDNIGVMTMKMMSITSITSTIGVTLMSATGGGGFLVSPSLDSPVIDSRRDAGEPAPRTAAPQFNSPDS